MKPAGDDRDLGWCEVLIGAAIAAATAASGAIVPGSIRVLASSIGRVWLGDLITGRPLATDVGSHVATALAWLDPHHTTYQPIKDLLPLVGVSGDVSHATTHLPPEIPLFLPMGLVSYSVWMPLWATFSALALAWSLRMSGIRAPLAYPFVAAFCLTSIGEMALSTAYPAIALSLVAGYRFRNRPFWSGLILALIASGRGVTALLMGYLVVSKRLRSLLWFGLVIGSLTSLAVVVEPGILGEALARLPGAVAVNVSRPDNFGVPAVLDRNGVPGGLAWMLAAAGIGFALRRPETSYWPFAWAFMVISPLAWAATFAQAIPLIGQLWMRGRWQRLASGFAIATIFLGLRLGEWSWPLCLGACGIGLALGDPEDGRAVASNLPPRTYPSPAAVPR